MGGPAVRLRHRLVDRTVLFVQGEFHTFIADPYIRKLVAPLGYTAGFLVVVLGRQQLFTENTLVPILPCCITATAKSS